MKLLSVASLSLLFVSGVAQAGSISLNKVQITDGSRIDLFFDSKIKTKQIKTEFFNDIIQLSLTDVSVYPAKISSISGMDLTKVFAYQYSPKLVRCRLTVKGTAEDFKDRLELVTNGKVLTLRIKAGSVAAKKASSASDEIRQSQAAAESSAQANETTTKAGVDADGINRNQMSSEEQALLDRVLDKNKTKAEAKADARNEAKSDLKNDRERTSPRLTSSKPLPSPWRALGVLAVMVMLMAGVGILVKKAKSGGVNLKGHKGLKSLIPFGINPKTKMIEVIATHHLGPKRSISVVRVQGRLLVLGVTSDSINLIAQLPAHATQDEIAEAAISQFEGATLASSDRDFDQVASPAYTASTTHDGAFDRVLGEASSKPRARDRIKSRLEGLKQL